MDINTLPILSLADDKAAFSQAIGRSFCDYGFAMVKDHGIPAELIERAWALTAEFFALPEEEKRRYFIPGIGGARGYTPSRPRSPRAPPRMI
jgi:isopenicillin N synthase-like dioxygenase